MAEAHACHGEVHQDLHVITISKDEIACVWEFKIEE
jgi:hypothetical protein